MNRDSVSCVQKIYQLFSCSHPAGRFRVRLWFSATIPYRKTTAGSPAVRPQECSGFALKGGGVKGFQSLQLAYSTNNVNFTNFGGTISMAGLTTYTLESKNLPTVTNGASTLYISLCFSGASDSGVSTASFIDNIQITAKVPEPTTATSGVLAVLAVFGLCWSQRRCLIESLRFRRA